MRIKRHLILTTALLFMGLACAVLYSSCIKDYCSNVTCDHDGVCVKGVCACTSGYEGVKCDQVWNEKFAGTWHADEVALRDTAASGHHLFDIQINGNSTKDSFYISGFQNTAFVIQCNRTAYRGFTMLADQPLNDSMTLKSGNGRLDSISGYINGLYIYSKKLATKDTLISINFQWKK